MNRSTTAHYQALTPGMPPRFERLRFVNDDAGAAGTAGVGTVDGAGQGAAGSDPTEATAAGSGAGDLGFPAKTPWRDMKPEEQVAYWQHQARKHESRAQGVPQDYDQIKTELEQLRARTQTAEEKAIEDAKREAREQGKTEARAETLPRLVRAEFKAAAGARITQDRLEAILAPLDLTKFLTADGGEVDADKVQQYVDGIAPADGKRWPDMGQGRRGTQKVSGVGAGRDLYADRRAKK